MYTRIAIIMQSHILNTAGKLKLCVGYLETKAKLRFLNHEDSRAQLPTNLEDNSFANLIWKCCKIDCYLYTGPC